MSRYPDILDHLDQPPIVPHLPPELELIKLRDCFPYRRFFPVFHHFMDPESGVLDYANDSAQATLSSVEDELRELGFSHQEISESAAVALADLTRTREYFKFVEEPGDLFAQP